MNTQSKIYRYLYSCTWKWIFNRDFSTYFNAIVQKYSPFSQKLITYSWPRFNKAKNGGGEERTASSSVNRIFSFPSRVRSKIKEMNEFSWSENHFEEDSSVHCTKYYFFQVASSFRKIVNLKIAPIDLRAQSVAPKDLASPRWCWRFYSHLKPILSSEGGFRDVWANS